MHTRNKGNIGESVAVTFLEKKGFSVIERNYFKKWGELDIVAMKEGFVHFFEVKSVLAAYNAVSNSQHRPEDNVHGLKLKRLRLTVETYLSDRFRGEDTPFQFHVLCVYLNQNTQKAHVEWIENVIL